MEMAMAADGHDRAQAPGLDIYRSFEWVRLAPPGIESLEGRNFRLPVAVPGIFRLPDNSSSIGLELVERRLAKPEGDEIGIDWGLLKDGLEVRNWRPGDRYHPFGRSGEERIKMLFQDARIPLWERRSWPVLVTNEQIVWSRRFGPAASFAERPETRLVLKVWEQSPNLLNP